jgi:type IV fimbrial biogenesis protein FimT
MAGFTLIELMVTLAIVAILGFFSVAMRDIIYSQRITSGANDFLVDLTFARSESLKRGTRVAVCSGTGNACSASASYTAGWLIFTDPNLNRTFDAGDELLRRREQPLGGQTKLMAVTGGTSIVFSSRGFVASGDGDGTYVVCDDRGPSRGREVEVTVTGQVRVNRATPAACTP